MKRIFAVSKLKLSCYFPSSLSLGAQHAIKQLSQYFVEVKSMALVSIAQNIIRDAYAGGAEGAAAPPAHSKDLIISAKMLITCPQ